jgi:glycosyltransferase involved in cell wall biosynthesis
MSAVDLSVVVPVRNQLAHNRFFLETLATFSRVRTELIVVDNDSTDGSAELFRKAGARVLATGGNLCYPESMNLGLTQASGEYVGFLNNDIVVSPGWDEALIDALARHRLSVVSPVGIERMPTDGLARAVQERWRLVKRRTGLIETADDLRIALQMMYGDWSRFCEEIRAAFKDRLVSGIVGSCVVMSRSFANQIGGWDPRVQAADWDLYLRLRQRAEEQGDVAPPMITGWVYVHHYVQATRRGERNPFTCTHPRLTVQEKWGDAGIRRWFFDPPLLAPARLRSAPASYLRARALRLGKDARRAVGAVKVLACGFPDAENLLSMVRRYTRTESGNTSRV